MELLKRYKNEFALLLIVLVAIVLRFYRLDYQSLWHDELFTLNQADPDISWKEMFHLLSQDTHPPLYMILERISFHLFGFTEWAARFIPAISGVFCVPAMYMLGTKLKDKRLGLVAAAICCVNYFNIQYSQEGRDYSLMMLLATMSYLYFLQTCNEQKIKNAIWFVVFTSLMIYTHYFGFLVMASEGIFVLLLIIADKKDRKRIFYWFLASFLAIGVSYLPWLPFMFSVPDFDFSFWIQPPARTFFLHYYCEYFGANRLTYPFLVILPAIFAWYVIKESKRLRSILSHSAGRFLVFFIVCFLFCHDSLYAYSVLVKPILFGRYLIFFIPLYIMLLSYGFIVIKHRTISNILLVAFIALQLWDLTFVKKFYTDKIKDHVREISQFITEDNKNYPMINEWMAWRHTYYLEMYGYKGRILNYNGSIWPTRTNKEWMVDSILGRSKNYDIDTFWIVMSNMDLPLGEQKRADLDTAFLLIKEKHYPGADAWLFGRKK